MDKDTQLLEGNTQNSLNASGTIPIILDSSSISNSMSLHTKIVSNLSNANIEVANNNLIDSSNLTKDSNQIKPREKSVPRLCNIEFNGTNKQGIVTNV